MRKSYQRFAGIVGESFVTVDPLILRAVESTTYPTTQRIRGIVCPGSKQEVQECLAVAQSNRIPIYPISSGKNWGYGGRVPITDDSVLLDLSRLNRIIDYDESLGYVTVETGVTFRQLFQFLRKRNSRLLLSVTSSSPDTSIVANTLERGIGCGPHADRISSACDMEVVLPTGDVIQTGFARLPKAKAARVHRHGLGPSLDGLFVQSNLGVVTSMTFWLVRRPEFLGILFVAMDSDVEVGEAVDVFRESASENIVRPPFAVFNRDRVLSVMETLSSASRSAGPNQGPPRVLAWNGDLAIYESNYNRLTSVIAQLRCRFESCTKSLTTFVATADEMDQRLQDAALDGTTLPKDDPFRALLIEKHLGIPKLDAVRQVYWKKQAPPTAVPPDPDRDRCGLLWCSPVVPLLGSELRNALSLIATVSATCDIKIPTSIQCTSERSATIIASILFDRDLPGEDERALKCHHKLRQALHSAGYYSYRENTLSLAAPRPDTPYDRVLSTLKASIDPNQVLASSRYL